MAEEGFFKRLISGLAKTRDNIVSGMDGIFFGFSNIDEDFYEGLEEVLIMGDLGVQATYDILDDLREKVRERRITQPSDCRELLIESIKEQMEVEETAYEFEEKTSVVMVVGVNGVGKTTTIGKLAASLKAQGKQVLLGAADTFRAAAIDQLQVWADRAGVEMVRQSEGADPAAVVFDAITAGRARGVDVIICDTAGRLHNKKNLMDELSKISRVIQREAPGCDVEVLLVLDATTGQNALNQARQFKEAAGITGIILTKLDGTARGGVVIGIRQELEVPIKYIGVGEQVDDLRPFNAADFVDALFGGRETEADD